MVEDPRGPIVVHPGEPPAGASKPDQALDPRFHTYESNPVPWWIAMLWATFLLFAAGYLIVNLIAE